MPEGHTLFRLAREVSDRFAGRRVAVTSPQGRFAESASLVDGTLLVHAESARAAGCRALVEGREIAMALSEIRVASRVA